MNKADNPLLRPSNPFENRTVRAIAQAKPNVASPRVLTRPLPGGTSLSVRSRPRSRDFIPSLYVGSDGRVQAGTVGGVMPTILGTRLDADPPQSLNISPTGTQYVVINIEGTMSTASYAGASFVAAAMTDVTVTITVESSSPTGADMLSNTGTFKLLLATFVDGIKTHQGMIGPVTFIIQDTLDGSGTGYLAHASN